MGISLLPEASGVPSATRGETSSRRPTIPFARSLIALVSAGAVRHGGRPCGICAERINKAKQSPERNFSAPGRWRRIVLEIKRRKDARPEAAATKPLAQRCRADGGGYKTVGAKMHA